MVIWRSPITSQMNSYINQNGPLEYTIVILKVVFLQLWRLYILEAKLNRVRFVEASLSSLEIPAFYLLLLQPVLQEGGGRECEMALSEVTSYKVLDCEGQITVRLYFSFPPCTAHHLMQTHWAQSLYVRI